MRVNTLAATLLVTSVAITACADTRSPMAASAKGESAEGGAGGEKVSRGTADGAANPCSATTSEVFAEETAVTISGGANLRCGGPLSDASGRFATQPVSLSLAGRITHVDTRSFTIMSCSSGDAGSAETRIQVESVALPADLTPLLPVGALVQVTLSMEDFFGCHFTLMVRNVAEGCGLPNPIAADDRTYLAVADGSLGDASWPFSVHALPLGCFPDAGLNCGGTDLPVDSYDLQVGVTGAPGTTRVSMGQTASFSGLAGAAYQIHDVRSFQTAACDDYWNWSLWIARE